jgi:hypothetical protein
LTVTVDLEEKKLGKQKTATQATMTNLSPHRVHWNVLRRSGDVAETPKP